MRPKTFPKSFITHTSLVPIRKTRGMKKGVPAMTHPLRFIIMRSFYLTITFLPPTM